MCCDEKDKLVMLRHAFSQRLCSFDPPSRPIRLQRFGGRSTSTDASRGAKCTRALPTYSHPQRNVRSWCRHLDRTHLHTCSHPQRRSGNWYDTGRPFQTNEANVGGRSPCRWQRPIVGRFPAGTSPIRSVRRCHPAYRPPPCPRRQACAPRGHGARRPPPPRRSDRPHLRASAAATAPTAPGRATAP